MFEDCVLFGLSPKWNRAAAPNCSKIQSIFELWCALGPPVVLLDIFSWPDRISVSVGRLFKFWFSWFSLTFQLHQSTSGKEGPKQTSCRWKVLASNQVGKRALALLKEISGALSHNFTPSSTAHTLPSNTRVSFFTFQLVNLRAYSLENNTWSLFCLCETVFSRLFSFQFLVSRSISVCVCVWVCVIECVCFRSDERFWAGGACLLCFPLSPLWWPFLSGRCFYGSFCSSGPLFCFHTQ